jgi:prevent-host-death family protein
MCYIRGMSADVGLRELRQNASEIVRRIEGGEVITVTVSGRAVAQLRPVAGKHWRPAADLAAVFVGPTDQTWQADRQRLADDLRDPFDQ